LSEILGELFTVRGYGRLQARHELEEAWAAAVGEPACRQTRLGEVRRGVLNVTVTHSALLEELAAFRKSELLAALRSGAPATTIHDIRFRVGAIEAGEADPTAGLRSRPSPGAQAETHLAPPPRRRGRPRNRPGGGRS
jgi:hypothetical protein